MTTEIEKKWKIRLEQDDPQVLSLDIDWAGIKAFRTGTTVFGTLDSRGPLDFDIVILIEDHDKFVEFILHLESKGCKHSCNYENSFVSLIKTNMRYLPTNFIVFNIKENYEKMKYATLKMLDEKPMMKASRIEKFMGFKDEFDTLIEDLL